MGHSSDGFGDPINCRFTRWIPGYVPQLLNLFYALADRPDQADRYLGLRV
jgi:hypothetical protein